ncbi:cyclic peptide export ABC transporter [Bacillus sp. BPN334]|uniref:cyclic peptide export ABC transporter n=1 Tax=Bacillus sp. BPN334 TaxID=2217815 RepID=UPI0011EBC791|nr:cyclic peptide export ABC transporter [Bacillus sp. BPN334]KAA0784691.1 cyclic peptide export ABC transporter [Bacillus sp. BPN334]
MKLNIWLKFIILMTLIVLPYRQVEAQETVQFNEKKIQKHIEEQISQAGIPGLSVVIVKGNETIYKKNYGYADTDKKRQVTNETLFELGSTSKAFTALAVLQLEKEGKIKLSDSLTKYVSWFEMEYKGKPYEITLYDLLHHTSGIPEKAIGYIPITNGKDSIEKTIRNVMPIGLNREPGSSFEYSTVNYDLLGLVIEKATNQSFERYVQDHVLSKLDLLSTYAGREMAPLDNMAQGYKRNFLQSLPYDAPNYRGNTPAGYFISNINDMERWLKLQLGVEKPRMFPEELINDSHKANRKVAPDNNGASYAAGWEVYQSGGGEISHGGSNPNYSSYIGFRDEEQIGVVVLANLNSNYTYYIGSSLLNMMIDKEVKPLLYDEYKKTDQIGTALFVMSSLCLLTLLVMLFHLIREIIFRKRRFKLPTGKTWLHMVLVVAIYALMIYALYQLPNLLFGGLPWAFIKVWAPSTVVLAIYAIAGVGLAYVIHTFLNLCFPRQKGKSLLTLIVLGLISGFGNAFLIFVINETFVRSNNLENGLLFYFVLGIVMYVFSQRIIRTSIVSYTNELVYEKRMELTDKLLQTPYYKLELIEKGRIEATLNNDTEVISRSLNLLVTAGTSLLTLLFCFLYLGVMNMYAFLLSLCIIFITAGVYSLIGRQADKVWNETRDIQNVYFRLIGDLRHGFKELRLHTGKRNDFREVMNESCNNYRVKRTIGDIKFANVFVLGELLFIFVIGIVVFVFPEIFVNMPKETISNYVIVFLYMTGPVNEILGGIPQLVNVRISWQRIQQMVKSVDHIKANEQIATTKEYLDVPICLQLQNVSYKYKNKDGDFTGFGIGPIDMEFNSGEIVFIAGGNGSGKSTLSKLITGLYEPNEGNVLLNGKEIAPEELNQYYSAILSDFHVFDRLYGINTEGMKAEIDHYLELLQLSDKVGIENGRFTTTQLSTGQKKRLALLVTYLEDRPILLFDEWAADQDPGYRRFFYEELLPQMRAKGKCIIAITHDDQYFHLADKLIVMEMGTVKMNKTKEALS